eukprot:2446567-Amphidinium_carterae.2
MAAASPGGGDDPGRDPSSILAKFDLFSESLRKNARDLLPNAVRDSTPPPRRSLFGYGGGRGGGPGDNDPGRPFGSPGGRDGNSNNRNSPPRPLPGQPGDGGDDG